MAGTWNTDQNHTYTLEQHGALIDVLRDGKPYGVLNLTDRRRYQAMDTIEGIYHAVVMDMKHGAPVLTSSGTVYYAMYSSAQWSADTLNIGEPDLPEPEAEPVRDRDGSDFDPFAEQPIDVFEEAQMERQRHERANENTPALDTYDFETQTAGGLEGRLEPTETLLKRLEPLNKRQSEQGDLVFQLGAYKWSGNRAETLLREALASLPDTLENVRARVKVESALTALESGREVAADWRNR